LIANYQARRAELLKKQAALLTEEQKASSEADGKNEKKSRTKKSKQ
jgi:hypothetical protein